jgi:hypothetical protein
MRVLLMMSCDILPVYFTAQPARLPPTLCAAMVRDELLRVRVRRDADRDRLGDGVDAGMSHPGQRHSTRPPAPPPPPSAEYRRRGQRGGGSVSRGRGAGWKGHAAPARPRTAARRRGLLRAAGRLPLQATHPPRTYAPAAARGCACRSRMPGPEPEGQRPARVCMARPGAARREHAGHQARARRDRCRPLLTVIGHFSRRDSRLIGPRRLPAQGRPSTRSSSPCAPVAPPPRAGARAPRR